MRLNADLSRAATVDSAGMPWVASPMAGVERRMLERDGDEVARATSLVRYAPDSSFPAHTHGAGEEILVLDGVFSDEFGDFTKGFYIRNPPGSRHSPSSRQGAVIFVKLRQMPPQDSVTVRLDTRDAAAWRDAGGGLASMDLYEAPWEKVVMLRFAPGHAQPPVSWPGGIELFVIEGELTVDGTPRRTGAWMRFPAGSSPTLSSRGGALAYRKTGHLG